MLILRNKSPAKRSYQFTQLPFPHIFFNTLGVLELLVFLSLVERISLLGSLWLWVRFSIFHNLLMSAFLPFSLPFFFPFSFSYFHFPLSCPPFALLPIFLPLLSPSPPVFPSLLVFDLCSLTYEDSVLTSSKLNHGARR